MTERTRYRLKAGAPVHYLEGRFYKAGEVMALPAGITPGEWLEPEAKPEPKPKPEAKPKA